MAMTDIVRADKVAFRYLHDGRGLESTSLSIRPGEAVLVTGISGCGKSTLARCMTGIIPHLYRGTLHGAVWLDGMQTTDTPLWQLTERAGLVFQNPAAQMLAPSVEEEIIFGLENHGLSSVTIQKRLSHTLDRFNLQALRDRSPQTLSSGEQQKLALAAITAREPSVLVLDEPLSMLDSTAVIDLITYLKQLVRSGTTVIICEHRREYLDLIPDLRTIHLDNHISRGSTLTEINIPKSTTSDFRLEVSELGVQLGGRTVLQDLDFCLSSGQVIAVVGRNGVGKTTLLRTLAGLQEHQGSIMINGEVGSPDLGLVFQNPDLQLFNPTVGEEILYRLSNPDLIYLDWLLEALELTRYVKTPPLLLSEGEKKRVALASVLIRQPRHGILLDEPALGQDGGHKAMLIRLLRALAASGMLIIMTTHDLALAAQADRLILLGPDGIAADGPTSEILRSDAPWQRLGLKLPDWVRASEKEDEG